MAQDLLLVAKVGMFSIALHVLLKLFFISGEIIHALEIFLGDDTGRVVIWNMAPVLSEAAESDENIPKMLCQLDNHLGKIAHRWKNDSGRRLSEIERLFPHLL